MASPTEALVVAGHGSHLNPDSSAPVFDHADTIRELGVFEEVQEAFWKEEPSLREVLRMLESDVAYVVPLFMSEGYFTDRLVPRELRLAEGWTLDVDLEVHYTDPVGTHGAMADVVVQRAETVTGDPEVGEGHGLAVVGHGTDRHEASARSTRDHAAAIRARGRFDEVRALFMDEEPYIGDLVEHFTTSDVVVVPLFVADGYHTTEDIPADLGLTRTSAGYALPSEVDSHSPAEVDGHSPAEVDGHRLWYAGAVGTEPLVAEVILERAAEAGATIERTTEAWRDDICVE